MTSAPRRPRTFFETDTRRSISRIGGAAVLGAGLLVFGSVAATPASAATTWDVDDEQSLVDALQGLLTGDTIDFAPGTTITLTSNIEDFIESVQDVTVEGNGSTIDGADAFHGFAVSGSSATINDLTFTRMKGDADVEGTGLLVSASSITLNNVTATDNELHGVTIEAASATTTIIDGLNVSGNGGDGIVASHSYAGSGDSVRLTDVAANDNGGRGVAIDVKAGSAQLSDIDAARNGNLGIDMLMTGTGSTLTVDDLEASQNAGSGLKFHLVDETEATATNLTARENSTADMEVYQDGTASLDLSEATSTNAMADGVLIKQSNAAVATLSKVTVTGASGAALATSTVPTPALDPVSTASLIVSDSTLADSARGISSQRLEDSSFTLDASTVSGNSTQGLYLRPQGQASTTITNSTISGNGSESASYANLINAASTSNSLEIDGATFQDNTASTAGLSIAMGTGQGDWTASTIVNSIFAGTTGGGSDLELAPGTTGASMGTIDYSLVQATVSAPAQLAINSGTGSLTGMPSGLGALQDNGGPTFTHLPAAGSPVINSAHPGPYTTGETDQRGAGFPRVTDGRLDMGAVEVQPTFPATPAAPTLKAGNGSLTVTWVAPADGGSPITGYTVAYREVGTTDWKLDTTPGTDLTRTLTGLTNGVEYEVRVFATNEVGNSDPSPSTTGTPVDTNTKRLANTGAVTGWPVVALGVLALLASGAVLSRRRVTQ